MQAAKCSPFWGANLLQQMELAGWDFAQNCKALTSLAQFNRTLKHVLVFKI